jgi:hypothetical protein
MRCTGSKRLLPTGKRHDGGASPSRGADTGQTAVHRLRSGPVLPVCRRVR